MKAADNGRYFVDQVGDPWFGLGDTAWSLIGQLDPAEVDRYLDDRAARGFNLVLANVLEHYYSDNAPNNYREDSPFTGTPFQSPPNEAYWQHVDYVVEAARIRGITLLLCPAYLGWSEEEGWSGEVIAASDSAMDDFGNFLRSRYGNFPNIMWLIGHDRVPDGREKARMEVLVAALSNHGLVGLGATPSADALGTVPWQPTSISPDFETVYTYDDTAGLETARAWSTRPARPTVFLEGRYEQERSGGLGDPVLRRQEYGAFVSGAAAVLFGNNPIWHFESVPLYPYEGTWHENLSSPGTRDAQLFGELVSSVPWPEMQPDLDDTLLVDGDPGASVAARFSESYAMIYVSTSRTVTLDLDAFTADGDVEIRRIDPRSGDSESAGVHRTEGLLTVQTSGKNAAGDDDWIYVILPAT